MPTGSTTDTQAERDAKRLERIRVILAKSSTTTTTAPDSVQIEDLAFAYNYIVEEWQKLAGKQAPSSGHGGLRSKAEQVRSYASSRTYSKDITGLLETQCRRRQKPPTFKDRVHLWNMGKFP